MPIFHLLILSIIQGITEFLPISSSAHLQIIPEITNLQKQTLHIDVAVHVGTLIGVIVFFAKDILQILNGFYNFLKGKKSKEATLFGMIILATVPIILAGGFIWVSDYVDVFRNIELIAWTTIIFGILLYFSDKFFLTVRNIDTLKPSHAIVIGLAQILAIIPGTSRSGIVITFARFLGYKRIEATRFAMLLSIPAILLPGIASSVEIFKSGSFALGLDFFISLLFSFIFSLISIAILMKWVKKLNFTPFAIYRVVIGGAILFWLYFYQGEKIIFF